VTVPASSTLAWTPGPIRFVGMATKAGVATCIDSGVLTLIANPALPAPSAATLAAIDAAIATYAANPHQSISVDGVSTSFRSLSDLMDLRAHYADRVARETGTQRRRIIRARFP